MGRKARRQGRARGGTAARVGKAGRPQIVAVGALRWSDAHEARFLDEIAAHCNVTRAARAVGFSTNAIYARRRNDPAFAERWQAALTQGYMQVEMGLIRRANEALNDVPPDPGNPVAPMTVKEALALLKMHQLGATGRGTARGRPARVRSLDEVRDSILTKLAAVARARAAGGEQANAADPATKPG